jgi:uncharacterized membrane protein YbaN (DUF454 family)
MNRSDQPPNENRPLLRWVLFCSGAISVALAVLGIFLPILPTVPFLLLALACFSRSSERFYTWLLEHNHLGPLLRPYLQEQRIPRAVKLKAIALLWLSIGLSVHFLLEALWLKALLLVIALAVTIYLLHMPEEES